MKEVKGWDISEKNNKIVSKHFNGATNGDMKSYIQLAISNYPECIVLHCGTYDLRQNTSTVEIDQKILELAASCKSGSNSILISGIISR